MNNGFCYLPVALRAAQGAGMRWYLIYSEADFEVFRLAGATRCTYGVKFGIRNFRFSLKFQQ